MLFTHATRKPGASFRLAAAAAAATPHVKGAAHTHTHTTPDCERTLHNSKHRQASDGIDVHVWTCVGVYMCRVCVCVEHVIKAIVGRF